MTAATKQKASQSDLSAAERRLIDAFRRADYKARLDLVDAAEAAANRWAAPKVVTVAPRSHLSLVGAAA
ncbi:hypothetical protein [Massilia sp. TS11]|uniref:hypothetical protein n=1 Tax=Massilia sp. TS11 TaxID=2908003 RepID=UPI001EDA1C32|nr:hypothetical protein [Massilia sp. TS11]MCG2586529.1 hypothetical protein [Massilia sp. TS11]